MPGGIPSPRPIARHFGAGPSPGLRGRRPRAADAYAGGSPAGRAKFLHLSAPTLLDCHCRLFRGTSRAGTPGWP
jgi:hypothetical protein